MSKPVITISDISISFVILLRFNISGLNESTVICTLLLHAIKEVDKSLRIERKNAGHLSGSVG